jgi:hypothetical protein
MRAPWLLALAALASCGPAAGSFTIQLELSQGEEYRCPQPECSQIQLSCNAVLSLRIVDAADPSLVYVSKCLPVEHATDLCAIGSLDLGMTNAVPNKMVRIEVLVWPEVRVPDLMCPSNVQFDAHDMPVAVDPAPAIGGQTYFVPGSSDSVVVPLGCLDVTALDDVACLAPGTVSVAAAVDDFDSGIFLPPSSAANVTVSVGEPKARTNPTTGNVEWDLEPADLTMLPQTVMDPVPAWKAPSVPITFMRAACVQVLETGTQETPTLTCHSADKNSTALDLRAFRLLKSTLAQAYSALRLPGVPDSGLVVGMVVDVNGNPLAGATVVPSAGTVSFLSADRTGTDPGNVTTSSGMFVSRDVPFDATWAATDGHGNFPTETPVIGGLVVGKATVVFLQIEPPPHG